MPSRSSRQHRPFFPLDWRELSRLIRFERARGRCQTCGRPHGALVAHLGDGRWWDEEAAGWRSGRGRMLPSLPPLSGETPARFTRVVLAAAHLDHDASHNTLRNLKALCQRCHMLHDRAEHLRRRRLSHAKRRALGDLFLGRYPGA